MNHFIVFKPRDEDVVQAATLMKRFRVGSKDEYYECGFSEPNAASSLLHKSSGCIIMFRSTEGVLRCIRKLVLGNNTHIADGTIYQHRRHNSHSSKYVSAQDCLKISSFAP